MSWVISSSQPSNNCVCGHPHEWTRIEWATWSFRALPCPCGCHLYEPDDGTDSKLGAVKSEPYQGVYNRRYPA